MVGCMIGELRQATAEDFEFCFDLHMQALGAVVTERFGGWDDALQRSCHEAWFDA
jgi:hypothetical protein